MNNHQRLRQLVDKLDCLSELDQRGVIMDLVVDFGPIAVPSLKKALLDERAQVRVGAARALGELGPDAQEAVPLLLRSLKDRAAEVRNAAAGALSKMGPSAIEPLIALVDSPFTEEKVAAIIALGLIGEAARAATPKLVILLDCPDEDLRRQSAITLGRIEKKSILDELFSKALDEPKDEPPDSFIDLPTLCFVRTLAVSARTSEKTMLRLESLMLAIETAILVGA